MSTAFDRYSDLIERFLSRQLSAQQFSDRFLEDFKKETELLGEPLFGLLDELFGDADSFTADPILLAKDPDFYLDETGLNAKARDIRARMQVWQGQQSVVGQAESDLSVRAAAR
jgi:hypothetical protein